LYSWFKGALRPYQDTKEYKIETNRQHHGMDKILLTVAFLKSFSLVLGIKAPMGRTSCPGARRPLIPTRRKTSIEEPIEPRGSREVLDREDLSSLERASRPRYQQEERSCLGGLDILWP
jgi:hypothetical protein